jgi:hypothetical protein
MEKILKEEAVTLSKYCPSICMEGMWKATINSLMEGEIQTEKLQNTYIKLYQYVIAVWQEKRQNNIENMHGDFNFMTFK